MENVILECSLNNYQLILTEENLIIKVESVIDFLPSESIIGLQLLEDDKNSNHPDSTTFRRYKVWQYSNDRKNKIYGLIVGTIIMTISLMLFFTYGFEGDGKIGGYSYFLFILGGVLFLNGLIEYLPKDKLLVCKKMRVKLKDESDKDFSFVYQRKDIYKIEQFIIQFNNIKRQ